MPQSDKPTCQRCGQCCASAYVALSDVLIDNDEREIVRWLQLHNVEVMKRPSENGDVAAINIPIPCSNLIKINGTAACSDYENRPEICKSYFCKRCSV